jgi:hypothetical protein
MVDIWQDQLLLPGEELEKTIMNEIGKAEVVCLLVSPNFINSDYCFSKEMEEALNKMRSTGSKVVPIIVTSTPLWHKFEIGKLSALPKDGKPVEEWSSEDAAWTDVVQKISKLVEFIQQDPNRLTLPAAAGMASPATNTPGATATPLSPIGSLQKMLAENKLKQAIATLLSMTEQSPDTRDEFNMALLLSSRWNALSDQEANGVITQQGADIERNRIRSAVIHLIEKLKD